MIYFSPFTPSTHASPFVILFSYLLLYQVPTTSLPQHQDRLQLRTHLDIKLGLKSSCKIPEQSRGCRGLFSLHMTVESAKT